MFQKGSFDPVLKIEHGTLRAKLYLPTYVYVKRIWLKIKSFNYIYIYMFFLIYTYIKYTWFKTWSFVVRFSKPCCPRSHGLRTKNLWASSVTVPQLLPGFLAKGHLPQVSRVSAIGKGNNEMIPADMQMILLIISFVMSYSLRSK